MELDDVRSMVSESKVENWNVMGYGTLCWEAGVYRADREGRDRSACFPRMRAAYKPNIALGLAVGLEFATDEAPPESANYPLAQLYGGNVDILYGGVTVDRWAYAVIADDDEGFRVLIPDPYRVRTADDATRYVISRFQNKLFTLLNRFHGAESIDPYLAPAHIVVGDPLQYGSISPPGVCLW